jgi:4-carboxymuconolactone decarboxylase
MRLKLLSPGEMDADQRKIHDEAIAGKRGAAPPPMMAWLSSPEMARHATRLGEMLRFNTLFPPNLSEIAILVTARHWTAHYEWWAHKRLALKGGVDPRIIDDIRDRRTPQFDDPKGRMIYDVAKSLHEGHGLSAALYQEAVRLTGRDHRPLRLLHAGIDDPQYVRIRTARRRSLRACVKIKGCIDRGGTTLSKGGTPCQAVHHRSTRKRVSGMSI